MSRRCVRDIGSIQMRQFGKYAIDVLEERDLTTALAIVAALHVLMDDQDDQDDAEDLFLHAIVILAEAVENIQRDVEYISEPLERKYLRFNSAEIQNNFAAMFRFQRQHMNTLITCLGIPCDFRLDNGSWVNGQEGLLIFLNFMAYPSRLSDKEQLFGWELSRLGRIFRWVRDFLYTSHRHRLEDYWHWHAQYWQQSKDAIQAKMQRLGPTHQQTANVCGFFDCFRVQVCRPSERVVEENGIVYHLDIQALVYNGHNAVHNLNWIGACNHFGLIVFFQGPHLGRGNDLTAFRDSEIVHQFETSLIQAQLPLVEFNLLGDRIFYNRPPCFVALPRGVFDEETATDSKCRTAIEWCFRMITENWKRITYPNIMRIFQGVVAQEITVAALLSNCLTLLHGSQTTAFFS